MRPTAPPAPGRSAPRTVRSHAGLHARRDEGDREGARPGRGRGLGAQIMLGNTYHLHFRPGDELIARARRAAPVHGVERTDPHRLRRVPGLLAPRHARARRRRRRHASAASTTAATSRFTPELAVADPARTSAATSRCASTRCRPPAIDRAASSKRRSARTTEWAERQRTRRARRRASCASAISQGGVDPELAGARPRRSPSSTSTATRSAGSRSARSARLMFETTTLRGRRCSRPRSRATSWASATPRGSSR